MSCLAVIAAAQHHTADPLAQAGPGLVPGAVGQHPAGCLNKGLRLGVNYPSNIILGPSYIGPPSQAGASAGVTEEQRLIQLQTVNKRALQCAGEEAAGARLEVECQLHSSDHQKSITSISVFSVISKISLLFGEGKGGH